MTDVDKCDRGCAAVNIATITVSEGDTLTVDCLEWIDQYWEFDNPTVVLRPIYREFETTHTEGAIEHVLIDLVCATEPVTIGPTEPHRWNRPYLCQVFREVLAGQVFRERNYRAERVKVRIIRDADGLTWEDISE